jgi:AraC-like DNA-binding protein
LKYKYYSIILFFCFPLLIIGQNNEVIGYTQLENLYKNSENDSLKSVYAKRYLTKAKKNSDVIKIADGYKLLALLYYPEPLAVKYSDSIIQLTKDTQNKKYPALGYNIKGAIFYELGNYKKALDEYLIGINYAKKNNNESQYLTLKFNIGLLKNTIGEREEAQQVFKEYLSFIENTNKKNDENYSRGLYALADSYTYSKESNLAEAYIKKGINYSLKQGHTLYYYSFIFKSGINNYFKQEYNQAIDSLEKAKTFFIKEENEKTRFALCNYYIGRSLIGLKQNEKSIVYFKKVDSILKITLDITPELIDVYKYLIEDAKDNKNVQGQLQYINNLIKFDSILDNNYKYLKKTIAKKYDTPELIQEKEKLISQLNKKEQRLNTWVLVLIISLIGTLIILNFYIRRNILNKKKYNELILQLKFKTKKSDERELVEVTTTTTTTTGIPKNIVEDILLSLNKFENSNKFVLKKYTLNSLAKEIHTNSSYLSKVINATKKISFANYLNNLRIDYAIGKLSKDKQFRSYTIKAIAESSGFNTAQSFTNAFYKKTGIYPSYFIKRIDVEKKNIII